MFAVFKKDLREWLSAAGLGGARRRGKGGGLRYAGLFSLLIGGVFLPLSFAQDGGPGAGYAALGFAAFFAAFSLNSAIADAFAGERERGTLETLFVSPLSDWALVFGKWSAGMAYALLQAAAMMLLASVVVGLIAPPLPPVWAYLAALLATVLLGGMFAGVEAWIAIGAETMRQALTVVTLPFTVIALAFGFGLPELMRALSPGQKAALVRFLMHVYNALPLAGWIVAGVAFLLVLDLALLFLTARRLSRIRMQA